MTALFYAAGSAGMLLALRQGSNATLRRAYFLLRLGALAHLLFFSWEFAQLGQVTTSFLLEWLALGLLLLLWAVSSVQEPPRMAWAVLPPAVLCAVLASALPARGILSPANLPYARSIALHILLALSGYTSFLVLSVAAGLYLWQSSRLKSRDNPSGLALSPDLVQLDRIQKRSLFFGLAAFTLAIGLGKLSPYLWKIPPRWTLQEVLSLVIWSLYVLLAALRFSPRFRRQLFAYGTMVGFGLVLVTFLLLKWIAVDEIHNFGSPF